MQVGAAPARVAELRGRAALVGSAGHGDRAQTLPAHPWQSHSDKRGQGEHSALAGHAGQAARLSCRPHSSLAGQSGTSKMVFLKEGNRLPRGLMNTKGLTQVFLALGDSFLM